MTNFQGARIDRSAYLNYFVSVKNINFVLLSHFVLIFLFYFFKSNLSLPYYIILSFLISVIHQKYISEWIHEAAHFNFIVSRKWNDIVINILGGSLFMNDIKSHRKGHFQHHSIDHFFTHSDPDTRYLAIFTKREFWKGLFCDFSGITAFKLLFYCGEKTKQDLSFIGILVTLHGSLLVLCKLTNHLDAYFIYYLSMGMIYPFINRIRVYGQHVTFNSSGGLANKHTASRTIQAGWLDRLFFTSKLMLFHYEHHKFPNLPYRALEKIFNATQNLNHFSNSRWKVIHKFYQNLPT